MKKLFLLSILLFQLTFVFGQIECKSSGSIKISSNKKFACDDEASNYEEIKKTYTEWRNVSSLKNLKYRIKTFTLDENDSNFDYNIWDIQFKNKYDKELQFNLKLFAGNVLIQEHSINCEYSDDPKKKLYRKSSDGVFCYTRCGFSWELLNKNKSSNYRIEISDVKWNNGEDVQSDASPIETIYNSANGQENNSNLKVVEDLANLGVNAVDVYQKAKLEKEQRDEKLQVELNKIKQEEIDRKNTNIKQAKNGDFGSMQSVLIDVTKGENKNFNLAENYASEFAEKSNSNPRYKDYFISQLIIFQFINGKDKEVFNNYLTNNKISFSFKDIINANLLIYNRDFFDLFYSEDQQEKIKNGISQLINLAEKGDVNAKLQVSYYKSTGAFVQFGINKNPSEGIKFIQQLAFSEDEINKAVKNGSYYSNDKNMYESSFANYLLGLIYLVGNDALKKDAKKGYKYINVSFNNGRYVEKSNTLYNLYLDFNSTDFDKLWFSTKLLAGVKLQQLIEQGIGRNKDEKLANEIKNYLDNGKIYENVEKINFEAEMPVISKKLNFNNKKHSTIFRELDDPIKLQDLPYKIYSYPDKFQIYSKEVLKKVASIENLNPELDVKLIDGYFEIFIKDATKGNYIDRQLFITYEDGTLALMKLSFEIRK